MVNVAKLALIIGGLFLAFIIRAKSQWLFVLGLILVLLVGFLVLTGHQGAASQFSVSSFFLLILALFKYLHEFKENER